jgi:hypothetical protein
LRHSEKWRTDRFVRRGGLSIVISSHVRSAGSDVLEDGRHLMFSRRCRAHVERMPGQSPFLRPRRLGAIGQPISWPSVPHSSALAQISSMQMRFYL